MDRPLDEHHAIGGEGPNLADRLHRHLLESLKSDYRAGDRFPSERDIARRFGVSRPTAARALVRLADEGLLEDRRGAGRFVRRSAPDYDLGSLVSFSERCVAVGVKATTEVLDFVEPGFGDLAPNAAFELQLLPGEGAYFFVRRRYADDRPVILEKRWLTARFCPGLTKADVAGSLYGLFRDRFHLVPSGARQVLRATPLEGKDRRLFWEDVDFAAFMVIATGYMEGGVPLWYEETLYRGDVYEFHNRLGPLETARPAIGVFRRDSKSP